MTSPPNNRPDKTAEALANAQRLQQLVDSLTDYAIYTMDPNGIITSWNSGAYKLKGYPAFEIIGQNYARFFTPEDRAKGLPQAALSEAVRLGRSESEGWRERKDGSRLWVSALIQPVRDAKGDVIGFAKVTRDITERRQREEQLFESERRFRLLVEGVVDYAIYMLDPTGIVTNWNAGAQRMKGYTASEIVGSHFSKFYIDEDRLAGLPQQVLSIALAEGRYEGEGLRQRKDGTQFWCSVVVDSIRRENGELLGFAKITRDITERRKAQLALEEAQAQRAYAQKIEALGQLTGGVAHDFNNLLMIVGGNLRTVRKLMPDDPKGKRALESIEIATKRGETLTRQLLTFSRRQSINPEVVQIRERLEPLRALLASSAGANVRLDVSAADDLWAVKVDLSEFELALLNQTLNARDAMPDGGVITLTAENVRLQPSQTPQRLQGDHVAITISDTGTGIAPDIVSKVFDPFFTTKSPDKGTGLGLSQVHGFAHQSGGTVTLESVQGAGTKITIYLPRSNELRLETAKHREEALPGGRALLIEDNESVSQITTDMLTQMGYAVRLAKDGTEAVAALKRENFDVMVSDIVMPGSVDGLAVARQLRRDRPEIPIVLVTGYSSSAAAIEGEFSVLRKPFQADDLSRALADAIAAAKARPK